MGKRSNFERNPRDYYLTPYEGVLPLVGHLKRGASFIEPCAGDGRLIRHLQRNGLHCVYACDIDPQPGPYDIKQQDVLFFDAAFPKVDYIITNPPWSRDILHPMIDAFRVHAPTWLLFDSDWMFTEQAKPYMDFCALVISVGRLSWMGNNVSGMDNCCWYLFGKEKVDTIFRT